MRHIPQEKLRKAFSYKEGKLFWNARAGSDKETKRFNSCFAGKPVKPCKDRYGYLSIQLDGEKMKMHRAVFAYHHGYYPETIDHINRDRADNRLENLRPASKSEQQWNKNGARGYSRKGNRWVARIKVKSKCINLGSYETEGEARCAYLSAKIRLHNSDNF